jgi:glycerol uptake facilitator-like aquaporin
VFNIEYSIDKPTNYPQELLVVLAPKKIVTTFGAFVTEVVLTCMFVWMCINSKHKTYAPSQSGTLQSFGVCISMFSFLVCAQKSGSCLNPAFGLA